MGIPAPTVSDDSNGMNKSGARSPQFEAKRAGDQSRVSESKANFVAPRQSFGSSSPLGLHRLATFRKRMKGLWNFAEFLLEIGCFAGFLWKYKLLKIQHLFNT